MDAQEGKHGSTVHAQGFSHSKGKQTIIWVFGCNTFGSNWLWATDPFLQLLQCLLRSGTITRDGNVLYLFNCKCLRLS